MSQARIKYRKQDLNSSLLPGFSKISQFSRPSSSLFQSLAVGLIEILLRFRLNPSDIKILSERLDPTKKLALELISYSNHFMHLENLFEIINNVRNASSLIEGFAYLAYYSETVSDHVNLAFDYGMRLFLCGLLLGKNYLHEIILNDQQLSEDNIESILHSFSTALNIAVWVFKPDGTKSTYSRNSQSYPLLSLCNNHNSFVLLYSYKTAEIETNPNFSPGEIEFFPFVSKNSTQKSYESVPGTNSKPTYLCNNCKIPKTENCYNVRCQICVLCDNCRSLSPNQCFHCKRVYPSNEAQYLLRLRTN